MKRFTVVVLLLFVAFSVTAVSAAPKKTAAPVSSSEKKMAGSAGLGITYPMGDMGDMVKFPIVPLLLAFQYAAKPFLTIEGDIYYYVLASGKDMVTDYSQYQFGVGVRYWLTKDFKEGKAYDGVYLGAGLARTNIEVTMEYTVPFLGTVSGTAEDDFNTLVLKGGYIYPLESVLLDLGVRYDAVDMKDWFDKPITIYAMAMMLF